jgi:hypothetical protein
LERGNALDTRCIIGNDDGKRWLHLSVIACEEKTREERKARRKEWFDARQ